MIFTCCQLSLTAKWNRTFHTLKNTLNIKKETEIEFLVSWLRYAPERNSSEPCKALHDSEQLHTYLTDHKLRQLIPKKIHIHIQNLASFEDFLPIFTIAVGQQ